MAVDLRCPGKRHSILKDGDVLEVKCNSRVCGANSNTVVIHRFSLSRGELIETLKFANPRRIPTGTGDNEWP